MQACEDGSPEHLMFCGVMEELETLAGGLFSCFIVTGYTKKTLENEHIEYNAKIRVKEEGDTPYIHVQVNDPPANIKEELQSGPGVTFLKKDQPEDAAIQFGEDDVIMRAMGGMGVEQPEEPQQPQGQSISGMVNQE